MDSGKKLYAKKPQFFARIRKTGQLKLPGFSFSVNGGGEKKRKERKFMTYFTASS